jgi:hypothetical protein
MLAHVLRVRYAILAYVAVGYSISIKEMIQRFV